MTDDAPGLRGFAASALAHFVPWTDPQTGRQPQREFLRAAGTSRVRIFRAGNQAQPLDEPVLTPTGWRPLGSLAPGQAVIAGDGTATTVVGVYPQGTRPVVRVTFDDGAWTRCTQDHLWRVLDREGRFPRPGRRGGAWRTATLAEIRWRWGDDPEPIQRVAIPAPGPVATDGGPLPLDPYLLGVLLGDGTLGRSGAELTTADAELTTADAEILAAVAAVLPAGVRVRRSGPYGYRLVAGPRGHARGHPLVAALRSLGLAGHRAPDKFVPAPYLLAAPAGRLALLQGLLDTDGTVGTSGHVDFSSTSARLTADVVYLVRSLGGKARAVARQTHYTHRGERRPGRPSWRVHVRLPGLPLFRLPRKLARTFDPGSRRDHRVLWRIRDDGEAPCACIAVAHPSGTYITRDLIVTHNSGKTTCLMVDALLLCLGWHVPARRPPPVHVWVSALDWEWGVGQVLWPAMKPWLPEREVRATWWYRRGEPEIPQAFRFRNGSELTFKSAEAGRRKYQGAPLDAIYLDEEHPPEIVEECRARLLKRGGMLAAALTPVRRERWVLDLERQPGTVVVRASSEGAARAGILDPEAVAEYAASLSDRQRRVRIEGDFAPLEGLVYPEFDRDRHILRVRGAVLVDGRGEVVAPWPLPATWPRYAAIDWGYAVPTALVVARLDPTLDLLLVERVAYAASVRASRWGQILPALLGGPLARPLVSDHDASERAELNALGIVTRPARKDVVEGIEAVSRRLVLHPGRPPRLAILVHERASEAPHHPVVGRHDGHALAWELEGYRYPPQPAGDLGAARDAPLKRDDHGCDSVRYLIMDLDDARPRVPVLRAARAPDPAPAPAVVPGEGVARGDSDRARFKSY